MRRNPRFYVAHCGGEPPMVPAPSQTVIPSVEKPDHLRQNIWPLGSARPSWRSFGRYEERGERPHTAQSERLRAKAAQDHAICADDPNVKHGKGWWTSQRRKGWVAQIAALKRGLSQSHQQVAPM
jgi:hypothetical protein